MPRLLLLLLLSDPVQVMARENPSFVGRPTVFVSHAWTYKFLSVLAALMYFAEEHTNAFFWFDCFSIDEHSTQAMPPDWWSTAFKQCIKNMGHTVMVLSPWHRPVPLTRSWCLWELYCTVDVGADFSVCLAPAEEEAFRVALRGSHTALLDALAHIDVATAEAGNPADKQRILAAVQESGGTSRLNALAMGEMRRWVVGFVCGKMLPDCRDAGDLGGVLSVANLLEQLGQRDETKAL